MKIPRDITGKEFAKNVKMFGYKVTRQSGSHIRLTTFSNGEHHITIPAHDPIKLGTLNSIINDIAQHLNKDKNEIINELFE